MKTLILAALIAFNTTPAYGAWMSGNQLLDYCTSEEKALEQGQCYGYIAGWLGADSIRGLGDNDPAKPFICAPPEATLGQLRDMVVKDLKESPETRHFGAELFVFTALYKAFKCPDFKKE